MNRRVITGKVRKSTVGYAIAVMYYSILSAGLELETGGVIVTPEDARFRPIDQLPYNVAI